VARGAILPHSPHAARPHALGALCYDGRDGGATVQTHTRIVEIQGIPMSAESMLNNCSGVWTATVTDAGRVIATGAGSSAEAAAESAIERARAMVLPRSAR